MFSKVRCSSNNSATMVAPLLWHGLTFSITRLTFASTYFRNLVRLAFIPSARLFAISTQNGKVFICSFVSSVSTISKGFANLTAGLGIMLALGASSKKGLLAVKLVSLVKTERIVNMFADQTLFSNKGFFRRIELIDNLSSKTVCALGLNALVDEFGAREVDAPKVRRGLCAISTA